MLKATVRMPDDVEKEYRSLLNIYGCSGNDLMLNLIRAEYHKIKEDPKIALALKQLQEMKVTLERMTAELKSAGFEE